MEDCCANWTSFWDLTSPQEAAEWLINRYGAGAATTAAAHCALAAYGDERDEDYRFWKTVFGRLRSAEGATALTGGAQASG